MLTSKQVRHDIRPLGLTLRRSGPKGWRLAYSTRLVMSPRRREQLAFYSEDLHELYGKAMAMHAEYEEKIANARLRRTKQGFIL